MGFKIPNFSIAPPYLAMAVLSLATSVAFTWGVAPKTTSRAVDKALRSVGLGRAARLFGNSTAGGATDADGMKKLPEDVVKYSQIPKGKVFTATTIPKGLLKDHTTKVGTWGVINVFKGRLKYEITEDPAKILAFELSADRKGIVEPQIHHHVSPLSNDVEFVVEFYRKPETGPIDEKREGL